MVQCCIENKKKEKILMYIKNRVCNKMVNNALDLGTVNK